MQIAEWLGTKKFLQNSLEHFALARCTGRIIKDTHEFLWRVNRVSSAEYDEHYDYLGNEIRVQIVDHTLTLSYKWNTTVIRIQDEVGKYIGRWLKDNISNSTLPWLFLKEKFNGTEDNNREKW